MKTDFALAGLVIFRCHADMTQIILILNVVCRFPALDVCVWPMLAETSAGEKVKIKMFFSVY